jgi:hypothetical protein
MPDRPHPPALSPKFRRRGVGFKVPLSSLREGLNPYGIQEKGEGGFMQEVYYRIEAIETESTPCNK